MLRFRLLGPIGVVVDGTPVQVGLPRHLTVLAALLIDPGVVVPPSTLIDRVWGDGAPEQARRTLSTYVTRLRRMLESTGPDAPRIVNEHGGYRLTVDRDLVDLHQFRRMVAGARDVRMSDTHRVELLREAVALWPGEPLVGISGAWAERTRARLVQERLEAVAAWAEIEVRIGNPGVVLSPLAELADEYPTLEPLTATLMRALVAAGRPSDALARGLANGRRLAAEFGTDQGPQLRQLYEAILRGDLDSVWPNATSTAAQGAPAAGPGAPGAAPATAGADVAQSAAAAPESAAAPVPAAVVPAQLPADVAVLVGRAAELTRLDLLRADAETSPTQVPVIALFGTAGVGKTAMAVHWAHRIAEGFPDGQLYINLRGFDPIGAPTSPTRALRHFLQALDVPPQRVPLDLEAQAAMYRSLLARRRMLIVLDNARDTAQVRHLLPGTPGCLVLVTSRNQLTSLVAEGASPVLVDLLGSDAASDLLTSRIGEARVHAEPEAVSEIVARCVGLPLALVLTAARAVVRPRTSLRVLAGELRETRSRWNTLSGDDPAADLRVVFSWSYGALSAEAALLFRLLGLHGGPDITIAAAASLAGIDVERADRALTELSMASLLLECDSNRFVCHDLLRDYAIELVRAVETASGRTAAIRRQLDHYLYTAHAADRLLYPTRDAIALLPAAGGVGPEPLDDRDAAVRWLDAERAVLLAAIETAQAADLDGHVWRLTVILWTYLHWRGHWSALVTAGRMAVAAAQRLPDPAAEVLTRRLLGHAYVQIGELDEARNELSVAADLCRESGDLLGLARTLGMLANTAEQQGRPDLALTYAEDAFEQYRAAGNQHGQARTLSDIGWCRVLTGEYDKAIVVCTQAIELLDELDDQHGRAGALDSLGYAHHHLGQYAEAIDCYERSVALFRTVGDRLFEAEILTHLGDSQRDAGDLAAARQTWHQAMTIFTELDHPHARDVATRLDAAGGRTCAAGDGGPLPSK